MLSRIQLLPHTAIFSLNFTRSPKSFGRISKRNFLRQCPIIRIRIRILQLLLQNTLVCLQTCARRGTGATRWRRRARAPPNASSTRSRARRSSRRSCASSPPRASHSSTQVRIGHVVISFGAIFNDDELCYNTSS